MYELIIFANHLVLKHLNNGREETISKTDVKFSFYQADDYLNILFEDRTPIYVKFPDLTIAGCATTADKIAKINAEGYATGGLTSAQLASSGLATEVQQINQTTELQLIKGHVAPKELKVFSDCIQVGSKNKPEPLQKIDNVIKIVAHGYYKPGRAAMNTGNVFIGLSPDDDSQMTLIAPGETVTILDLTQDNKYINSAIFYADVEVDGEGLCLDYYILPI